MTTVAQLPPEATTPTGRLSFVSSDAASEDRPDNERAALRRMRPKWDLPDTLLGGTPGMQEAKTKVLQQENDETDAEYERRSKRTVLTNYYGDTLDRHSGMPFAQPIQFDPPLPERLAYLEYDADGCGRSLTVFARDLMRDGMHRGVTHLLVDVPKGESSSYADTLKRRPRLVHIEAGALLSVDDQPANDGEDVVTYARFTQKGTKAKGSFGEEPTESIFEIVYGEEGKDGTTVEWVKQKDGSWLAESETPYTQESIPLFTFYAAQVGEYEGHPAYRYLAELNLAHYQSDADQRHALSYGRRATLVQTGWAVNTDPAGKAAAAAAGQGGGTQRTAMGYGRVLRHPSNDASASLLETNGAPLAAGRDDLKGLEERMERFGAAQVSKGGGITATSRELDDKRDSCNLQAWCTRMEGVLLHAIRAVAKWLKIELPEAQAVKINRDFASNKPRAEDFPMVQAMGVAGFLEPVDVLREAKVRGILTTVKDPEEAAQRVRESKQADAVAAMEGEIFRQRQADAEAAAANGGETDDAEPADGGGQK